MIFGFKANKKVNRLRIEIEDENGAKAVVWVSGLDTTARYYEFLREYAPLEVDFSRIRRINILIDSADVIGASLDELQLEMGLA
jgi:hypothetical protein